MKPAEIVIEGLGFEEVGSPKAGVDRAQTVGYNPNASPPNLKFAKDHGKARRVYYSKQDDNVEEEGRIVCECCTLPIEGQKIPLCANLDKIYHLGSGFALYFQFIKYSIGLLVLFLAVSGIFNLITNSHGNDCSTTDYGAESAYCVKGYILSYTLANKRDDPDNLKIQLYLNLATVVMVMLFFHFMRYSFRLTVNKADDKTITPSDYTISLEGVPAKTEDNDIKEWIKKLMAKKENETVEMRIIRPRQLGPYLKIVNRARVLNESEKKGQNPKHTKEQDQQRKDKIHKELFALEGDLKKLKEKGLDRCHVVYVIFEQAKHAYEVQNKFHVSLLARIFGFLLSPVYKGQNNFNGHKLKVKRAPEPSDIIWENLEFTRTKRRYSQWFTTFITIVLILLSFGLILLVNWGQSQSVNKFGKGSIVVQIFSVVASIVITLTNFIMSFVIDKLTKFEKHHTFTHYLRGIAQKLAAAQFINTALTNLFAELILASEDSALEHTTYYSRLLEVNFYGKGGLLENMFWVFIISAIQGPALIYFDFGYLFKRLKRLELTRSEKKGKPITITQKQANDLHEGSNIPMPARFAALIKVMLLTTFYAPAIPIAAVFTIAGLILWYWAEKYNLLRRSVLPPSLDDELANAMIEYLEWAACTFAIGNIMYVFSLTNLDDQFAFPITSRFIVWITLGISLFHILFPMGVLNETLFPIKDNVTETKTYEEARIEFQTDYDIENPLTRKRGLKAYFKRIYKAKKTVGEMKPQNGNQKLPKIDVNEMLALAIQKQTEAMGSKDSSSSMIDDPNAEYDFDFLDLYANKIHEHHHEQNQRHEHSKKAGNVYHDQENNDNKVLEKILGSNNIANAENLAVLAKMIPGIDQNDDEEPSLHKEHLETENLKPSLQGTRAREYAADSPLKAFNNTSPNQSPTREPLVNKEDVSGLDFFLSPLTGKSRKSIDASGNVPEGQGRIFLFGKSDSSDQKIKNENDQPDEQKTERKGSAHKDQVENEH